MSTIACLIRCRDSARTLPGVLASLRTQTRQPDVIVGIDNGSQDATPDILARAGAIILPWDEPYSHPRVLNFGLSHSPPTDYVLVLSSHTALLDPHTIERFAAALDAQPQAAAISIKWGPDCYSDAITYQEVSSKGMRFSSIYTNSLGMLRRSCWEQLPFDEEIPSVEDYDWSLTQLAQGRSILRLPIAFDYRRKGHNRAFEDTRSLFRIAAKHRHQIIWLGPKGTLRLLAQRLTHWLLKPTERESIQAELEEHWARLTAWTHCRFLSA